MNVDAGSDTASVLQSTRREYGDPSARMPRPCLPWTLNTIDLVLPAASWFRIPSLTPP
jgi:hypothetical protein